MSIIQVYEVIGAPPNVSVPTHFAKVVLASRPADPSSPDVMEISTGAFVLPNDPIADETPLEKFVVPGLSSSRVIVVFLNELIPIMILVEAVEHAAGLTLFSDAIKAASKQICQTTKCEVVVRRFDDAQKKVKAIAAPK